MIHCKTAMRAGAAQALTISLAPAQPLPCQGRYKVISSDVIMSAGGVIAADPRRRNEGTVDLTYDGCDRIVMEGHGMRMPITRSATSGWTGVMI